MRSKGSSPPALMLPLRMVGVRIFPVGQWRSELLDVNGNLQSFEGGYVFWSDCFRKYTLELKRITSKKL